MLKFPKKAVFSLLDQMRPTDQVTIAADQGVYLMSEDLQSKNHPDPTTIIYANGCDPDLEPEWYHNKVENCGGDDFGEKIGTAETIRNMFEASPGAKFLKVHVTLECITVTTDVGRPRPKKRTLTTPKQTEDAYVKIVQLLMAISESNKKGLVQKWPEADEILALLDAKP